MQVSHNFLPDSAVFDDDNLVSCAGLVPVMTLAEQTGLLLLARRPTFVEPLARAWRANFARAAACFLVAMWWVLTSLVRPGRHHQPGSFKSLRPGHVLSPGDLLAGVTTRLITWAAVLPGHSDAIRVTGWVQARCAGHVDAALARWPAIVRRNRALGALAATPSYGGKVVPPHG